MSPELTPAAAWEMLPLIFDRLLPIYGSATAQAITARISHIHGGGQMLRDMVGLDRDVKAMHDVAVAKSRADMQSESNNGTCSDTPTRANPRIKCVGQAKYDSENTVTKERVSRNKPNPVPQPNSPPTTATKEASTGSHEITPSRLTIRPKSEVSPTRGEDNDIRGLNRRKRKAERNDVDIARKKKKREQAARNKSRLDISGSNETDWTTILAGVTEYLG